MRKNTLYKCSGFKGLYFIGGLGYGFRNFKH